MILILIIALTEKSMGEENFIFSPYSIRKAFSVAMLASKGKTRKELQNALSLIGENRDVVKGSFHLKKNTKHMELSICWLTPPPTNIWKILS